MPVLYTLIVKRKSQVAFSRGNIEIYIDGYFRGIIKNGQKIRFQCTKDMIKLHVRDVSGMNIFPFSSQSITITPSEAGVFEYQIQYGINDAFFIGLVVLLFVGFFIGMLSQQPLFYLLSIIPFIYLIGFRLFDKKNFLFIKSQQIVDEN